MEMSERWPLKIQALVLTMNRTQDGRQYSSKALDDVCAMVPGKFVFRDFSDLAGTLSPPSSRAAGQVLTAWRSPEGIRIGAEVEVNFPPGVLVLSLVIQGELSDAPIPGVGKVLGVGCTNNPSDKTLTPWREIKKIPLELLK